MCCLQFIYKSDAVNMDPQKIEIQQCFLRAGAEMDAWKYTWRVGASTAAAASAMWQAAQLGRGSGSGLEFSPNL